MIYHCKDCTEKYIGCHGDCEKYKQDCKKKEQEKKKRYEDQLVSSCGRGFKRYNKRK